MTKNEKLARGTDHEDGPEIVYVPHHVQNNYYDAKHEAIVLDERLKEWPEVHDHILEHELKHYNYGYGPVGALKNIVVEIQTDWLLHVSTSEMAGRIQEYYDAEPKGKPSITKLVSATAVNFMRGFFQLFILPTGFVYRTLRQKSEWALERIQKVMA
jgi:hypothetical protein